MAVPAASSAGAWLVGAGTQAEDCFWPGVDCELPGSPAETSFRPLRAPPRQHRRRSGGRSGRLRVLGRGGHGGAGFSDRSGQGRAIKAALAVILLGDFFLLFFLF